MKQRTPYAGALVTMRAFGRCSDMTNFATAMLTIASGVGLTTLIGLYAAFHAWRHSIRVWVHPKTHQSKLIALTGNGGRMTPAMEYLSLAVMLLFFVALPIVSIIVYIGISGSILASNPSGCWQNTDPNQVDP